MVDIKSDLRKFICETSLGRSESLDVTENTFQIVVNSAEINLENFDTISQIEAFIQRKLSRKAHRR